MKNNLYLNNEEQKSIFWWRANDEFVENGHLKVDKIYEDLSKILTPRLKVIREMERLNYLGGDGLDDMRHKLLSYRAGDFWLPIGGINKEEMNVPQVITIMLTGLIGSGKSAFVNLMYSVLGGYSNYTTMYLEEHNVLRSPRSGFCVYDTRGLDPTHLDEGLDEISTWMSNGVRHNNPCHRSGDDKSKILDMMLTNSRYIKRKVNCVMVVADLSHIHRAFTSGDLKSMKAIKDLFHLSAIKNSNENPILVLTHGDTLNFEDRLNGRLKICEYLGIAETNGAYDIACLTEQGILADEYDLVTVFALTEAVYRGLLQSDRTHVPKKKFKDYIVSFFEFIMCWFASFFAILADFFAKFGHHGHKLKK